MKLVLLTYLEEDEACLDRLLTELDVKAYSRLAVEGHGPGTAAGWYAAARPYRSELTMVFTDEAAARRILEGVRACTGVQDPKHPIRAFLLDVEQATACGCDGPDADPTKMETRP